MSILRRPFLLLSRRTTMKREWWWFRVELSCWEFSGISSTLPMIEARLPSSSRRLARRLVTQVAAIEGFFEECLKLQQQQTQTMGKVFCDFLVGLPLSRLEFILFWCAKSWFRVQQISTLYLLSNESIKQENKLCAVTVCLDFRSNFQPLSGRTSQVFQFSHFLAQLKKFLVGILGFL